jgi:hypothetical protein
LAALAGDVFLGLGPDRSQVRVVRADPDPLQFAADVPGTVRPCAECPVTA